VGFLPLNMYIYSTYWIEDGTDIPYLNMVITVIYLWISVIIGYFVGRKWPKSIPYITRIGSLLAFILILTGGFIQNKLYPELFDLRWTAWFGGITLPVIGFVLGFIFAMILCQGHKQRLAVGFETGVQNTALALTVIAFTFEDSYEKSYWSQFILIYTTFQLVFGIGGVFFIWIYNRIRYNESPWDVARRQELARNETFGIGTSSSSDNSDSSETGSRADLAPGLKDANMPAIYTVSSEDNQVKTDIIQQDVRNETNEEDSHSF